MSRALRDSQKKHWQNNYLTAVTKHSRPILKPFLESKQISLFQKTLKNQLSKMNLSVLAVPWHGCQKKNTIKPICRKIAPQH